MSLACGGNQTRNFCQTKMPPLKRSPSPRRDVRAANNHRRRTSFDAGLILREKNDDLALFNDMENRERNNFLLHSTEDFDDHLYVNLNASVTVQGGKNDLLNADGERNEYDWLLTPPDTPLFASLDDEILPVNFAQRGRLRSQSICISKSATSQTSSRTSRTSASPQRVSTSPQSSRTSRGNASPRRLSPSPQSNRNNRGIASPRGLSPSPQSNRTNRGNASPLRRSPSPQPNRTNRGNASPLRRSPSPQPNRTCRGNASPHRLSPSSRSQSRERPSSAPHSSPPPHLRPITPSKRTSTPPTKPSTHPRSSTPTSRKVSTISSDRCGNSGSAKVQAWPLNVPGFSMDTPPNLRTSLSDRPVSYVRGSSPASRNRIISSSEVGRQAMTPTAPGSLSSFSNVEQKGNSPNKGYVDSNGGDNVDSPQFTTGSMSDYAAAAEIVPFPKSEALISSHKPSTISFSTSIPTRSIDSAVRQMEGESSQNAFKPLVSNIPYTGAYNGKTSSDRAMFSKNSKTNSNIESFGQGENVSLDIDGSVGHDTDVMVLERIKVVYPDDQGEVFNSHKVNEIKENFGHKILGGKPSIAYHGFDVGGTNEIEQGRSAKFSFEDAGKEVITTLQEPLYVSGTLSEVGHLGSMSTFSNGGNTVCVNQLMDQNGGTCPDCSEKGYCMTLASSQTTMFGSHISITPSERTVEENNFFDVLERKMNVSELQKDFCRSQAILRHHEIGNEHGARSECSDEGECMALATILGTRNSTTHSELTVEEDESSDVLESKMRVYELQEDIGSTFMLIHKEMNGGQEYFIGKEECLVNQKMAVQQNHRSAELEFGNSHSCVKIDISEGSGVSVLLKLSSDSKWAVVQGSSYMGTNVPCDVPPYARESQNSMRTVSTADLCSSRQSSIHDPRQLDGRKAGIENVYYHLDIKPHRSGSPFSETPEHSYIDYELAMSSDDNNYRSVGNEEGKALNNTGSDDKSPSSTKRGSSEGDGTIHTLALESFNDTVNVQSENILFIEQPNNGIDSCGTAEMLPNAKRSISDFEEPHMTHRLTLTEKEAVLNSALQGNGPVKAQNANQVYQGSRNAGMDCTNSESITDEQNSSASTASGQDSSVSPLEFNALDHTVPIPEESTVIVQLPGHERSVTIEEVTDTILFCRSIIQNIAYQATTAAVDREQSICSEGSRPRVAIGGKASSDRKDLRARSGSRRALKNRKGRRKQVEINVKTPSIKIETEIKLDDPLKHNPVVPSKVDSTRHSKLQFKCNCVVM